MDRKCARVWCQSKFALTVDKKISPNLCRALPPRTGAHPIDHALTYFDHVQLPSSALLGSLEKPPNEREQFFSTIQRVSVGTLFLSSVAIPILKLSVFNAAQFSLRRSVMGHDGSPMAVMKFRTQQLPILHAIAQYHVLQAYLVHSAAAFKTRKMDPRVRHGIATAFKAVAVQHAQKSIKAINDGCGWHGFYEHNQLLQLEVRGIGFERINVTLTLPVGISSRWDRRRGYQGPCNPYVFLAEFTKSVPELIAYRTCVRTPA
jgi:alkylation response protein AidB-like acyl-CoA dehydrogenase